MRGGRLALGRVLRAKEVTTRCLSRPCAMTARARTTGCYRSGDISLTRFFKVQYRNPGIRAKCDWRQWSVAPTKKSRSIRSGFCLTSGPLHLPHPVLHTVSSRTFSFNLQYPLFSLSHAVASYVFFLVFSSLLSFPLSFFP